MGIKQSKSDVAVTATSDIQNPPSNHKRQIKDLMRYWFRRPEQNTQGTNVSDQYSASEGPNVVRTEQRDFAAGLIPGKPGPARLKTQDVTKPNDTDTNQPKNMEDGSNGLINIEKLQTYYKNLKCDKSNKIDDFISHYETKLSKSSTNTLDHDTILLRTYRDEQDVKLIKCEGFVNAKECEIAISTIRLNSKDEPHNIIPDFIIKKDLIRGSDMIALQYLFGIQQLHNTRQDSESIASLQKDSSLLLGKQEARALKASLLPLFSSTEHSIDQIPEQFQMKKLTFENINNPSTERAMIPYYDHNFERKEPVIFQKGSDAYNQFFIATDLGKIAARIHKKYYSSSNIDYITISTPTMFDYFATITVHFNPQGV